MGDSFSIGRAFSWEYTKVTTSEVRILQRLEKVSGREYGFGKQEVEVLSKIEYVARKPHHL
jgi:hypothetical protein